MGAQEWAAGQVASVTITSSVGETLTYARAFWDAFSEEWVDAEAGRIAASGAFWTVTDVRPLVVLDLDAWWSCLSDRSGSPAGWLRVVADCAVRSDGFPHNSSPNVRLVRWLADQIEEQTRPPKPAEPTGLGAVVEASCECDPTLARFVRDDTGGGDFPDSPWKAQCGSHDWAHLTVTRVLSEGVQP